MTPSEFLEKARQTISDNPYDRLTTKTKEIIDRDNFVADIHCHFFDIKCINIKYFLLRFIKDQLGLRDDEVFIDEDDPNIEYLKTSYDTIYDSDVLSSEIDTDEDWEKFTAELDYVAEQNIPFVNNTEDETRGVWDVIKNRRILKCENMSEVFDHYLKNYALNHKSLGYENKDLLTTTLMMDLGTGWDVKLRKSLKEQIEELKDMAGNLPTLPYYPVDPRRADSDKDNLYELFLQAFPEQGNSFFGLKVYPGLGYMPSDHRLFPIYEICQEKNIPVLSHCGGEAVTTHSLEAKAFREDEEVTILGHRRQQVAAQFNHPKEWIPVLEKFPKLKVNLGHFGGDTAWEEYGKTGNSEKVKCILDMMDKYEGVYADFSFNVINPGLYAMLKTVLDLRPTVASRTLYGSDFWVVCAQGDLRKRQSEFFTKLKDHAKNMTHTNIKKYLFSTI